MEQQDNPYEILGVRPDASESQIRSAYRKAALRNHPDKVSEPERPAATVRFAKISHAYEILSDPQKRELYHQAQQQQQQQAAYNHNGSGSSGNPRESPFYHAQQDPFFFSLHRGFHDPFQVFNSVFREEFGGPRSSAAFGRQDHGRGRATHAPSPMDAFFGGGSPLGDPFFPHDHHPVDSFFGDAFFGRGGGASPFGRHDVSSAGGGGSGRARRRDPFADMMLDSMRHMDAHMRQAEEQMWGGVGGNHQNNNHNPHQHQSFYYSSSSTSSVGRGGETVTTQSTRRIVNGQEETVTERIVQKADGTVERQVLDDNHHPYHSTTTTNRRRLQGGHGDLGDGAPAALPPPAAAEDAAGARGLSRLLPWGRRKDSKQAEDLSTTTTSQQRSPPDTQKRRREP